MSDKNPFDDPSFGSQGEDKNPFSDPEFGKKNAAGDLGRSVKAGIYKLPGMVTGLADIAPALAFNARPFSKAADALGDVTGFKPGQWAKDTQYSQGYQDSQKDVGKAWEGSDAVLADPNASKMDYASKLLSDAPSIAAGYLKNPMYSVNQVAESVPAMLAGGAVSKGIMGAGRLAGVGSGALERAVGEKLAAPIAGGAGEGITQAGQAMGDFTGEDAQKGALSAIGSGLGTAAIGVGAGRLANKMGLETAGTAMAKAGDGTVGYGINAGKRVLGGAASEGLLQELPQSVQEQAWQNYAEGKPLTQGLARAGVEGAISGGFMGAGANIAGGHGAQPTPIPEPTGEIPAPIQPTPTPVIQPTPVPVIQPTPVPKSEQMGIDSTAGPMSKAAATAVDTGVHDQTLQAAQLAEVAANQPETAQKAPIQPEVAPETPSNLIAEQAINTPIYGSAYAQRQATAPKVEENDILGADGTPFSSVATAKHAAQAAGEGFRPFKIAEKQFVVRNFATENIAKKASDTTAKPEIEAENAPKAETQATQTGTPTGATGAQPTATPAKAGAGVLETPRLNPNRETLLRELETGVMDVTGVPLSKLAIIQRKKKLEKLDSQPKENDVVKTAQAVQATQKGQAPTSPKPVNAVPYENRAVPADAASTRPAVDSGSAVPAGVVLSERSGSDLQAGSTAVQSAPEKAADIGQLNAAQNIANETINTPASGVIQAAKPVPAGLAKMRAGKTAKAIERIAKGTAYFSTTAKAKEFIESNGLKDTHEFVKHASGANRWDVVAKAQPAQLTGDAKTERQKEVKDNRDNVAAISKGWNLRRSVDFKPDASQQKLMDAVAKEIDSGTFYSDDMKEKVAKALNISDEEFNKNTINTVGGNFGMEVYYAQQAIEAQRAHQNRTKIAGELGLKVGDSIGTIINNDSKQTTSVKITSIRDDHVVTITGKRGVAILSAELSVDALKNAINRAKEQGKRKDGYDEFIAERSPKPIANVIQAAKDSGKLIVAHAGEKITPKPVSTNTIFTEDAANAARERLKAKIGRLNSGIDPETLMDGITLAGYHIEKGARTFSAYAKAMIADLGDGVKPYLKSWYMGIKFDPRAATFKDMDNVAQVEAFDVDAPQTPNALTDTFYDAIKSGNMPKDNPALRKMVESFDGKPAENARLKEAQEELEAAIARTTRDVIDKGESQRETFDALLRLYNSQPLLNIRTSTSIANQAYSTPAPLAYLASELAGITKADTVLEPTGGTGMLIAGANPSKTLANELNDHRAELLRAQGFTVTQDDATNGFKGTFDKVNTNPPFGSIKDDKGNTIKVPVDGYRLGQIDHLIAARALAAMKDDGKATLILGANKVAGGISNDDLIFFNWLYGHYNVTGHFEVEGDLYARQGAGWPVRVISINGRQASNKTSPIAGTIKRADNWSQVYEYFTDSLASSRTEPNTGAEASAGGISTSKTNTGAVQGNADGQPAKPNQRQPAGSKSDNGDVAGATTGAVPDSAKPTKKPVGTSADTKRLDAAVAEPDRLDAGGVDAGSRADKPAAAARTSAVGENEFQASYVPRSSRKDEGVLIPVNMKEPTQDALSKLEDAVGNIDDFATKELGYANTKELHDALMGLQVDSVASSIYQIKQGKGVVIADQTGIGKGRQAAAIIRWAAKEGHIPVFVTVKPSLFTDMYGDLADIGTNDINPFIMNGSEWISGEGGEKLFSNKPLTHKNKLSTIAATGELPTGSNALFMTYSQINVDNTQRKALTALADKAVFILDESHNAGGASATGEFITSVLGAAKGVTYLSATYAKRPDNMPLYFKTDIGQASADNEGLMAAMAAGGLPLQTVVSNNLVKAGQMFRRERSYDGVSIESKTDSSNQKVHEALSDKTTAALRAIVAADGMFHEVYVKELSKQLAKEGARAIDNAGNQAKDSVQHTEFSSVVHNFVRQMLLGLKAQSAADDAISALKRGEKPIIAVENTMGSFLNEYAGANGVTQGGSLGSFDYRTVLSRALARTRVMTEQKANGEKIKKEIPLSALDGMTRAAYAQAQEVIDGLDLDIPVSPIDWMRSQIQKAGYSVAEITGRSLSVDYAAPLKPVLSAISAQEQNDKVQTTRLFNSGKLDALILNVAGSTGISLHASEKFTDQRQRHMIVAQPAQDINIFMQMLGRIHRTGQVKLPKYTILSVDLPTEKRPTALLSKKMKSLNANTSSNTESATSVKTADMLNKYGDQIVGQYLKDNYHLTQALGLDGVMDGDEAVEDIARKATGRLALQPITVQNAFYSEVEGQYNALLDYLNKTNQNDLEPRTFDFDAKELKQEILFEGADKNTPFGEDAIYGEYSIKAQGLPMKPDEINAEIQENLGGKTSEAHIVELGGALIEQYKAFFKTLPEGVQQETANKALSEGKRFLQDHRIGKTFRVDINGDTFNAVVTNIRSTHKTTGNPLSMSKIQVSIAVNGALRHISVPATQFQKIEVSTIGTGYTIEQLFKEQPADQRETAKIVTGNLLAAYGEIDGARGTIISFTKTDGTTDQGILLPKTFDFTKNTRGDYRLSTGAIALKFLQESDNKDIGRFGIRSRDNVVQVLPNGKGIAVLVPKSKLKGGKYFLDQGLIGALGDFVTSGNYMKASTEKPADAVSALDLLMKKQALYALPSMAEEAKEIAEKNDTRFSRGQSVAGLPVPQVKSITDSIKSKWTNAPEIVIAANMDDKAIPQAVRDHNDGQMSQGAQGSPEGFLYGGKVYLVADQLATPTDVMRVLFHESLGHVGLRGTFGDSLTPILQQVAMFRQAETIAKAREYGLLPEGLPEDAKPSEILKAMSEENRLTAAEEVLAVMAQTKPEMGFVKRAIAAIRSWLRAHGVNLRLSDSDIIASYILPARAWVQSGKGSVAGKTAFARGELTEQSVLERRLATAKQEILADMASGQVPKSVNSFSELHDYVDANEYVNDADRADNLIGNLGRANGWKGQDYIKFTNKLIDAVDAWLANGMKSANQTDTPAFKAWFGDSKVVDSEGKPLVVYHGTASDFNVFGTGRGAIYFTSDRNVAQAYAKEADGEKPRIVDAYLSLKNPRTVTAAEIKELTDEDGIDWMAIDNIGYEAEEAGHDGLILKKVSDFAGIENGIRQESVQDQYVAFRPEQIKSSIGNNGSFDASNPDIRFSRSTDKIGETLKAVTVTDIKAHAGNKLADYRNLGLQFLGGRQLADLYGKDIPQIDGYTKMVQQMSADSNEVGAQADSIVTGWAKLTDERQLAELMHDATLMQIDPAKDYVEGDNRLQWGKLNAQFKALSAEAKAIFTQARDAYEEHYAQVREAIRDKIERSEMSSESKARMLERMDGEFFEKIKGVYFPLARFGKYVVVTRDTAGNVLNVSRAETLNEAEALRKQMFKAYPAGKVGKVIKDKEFNASRDAVGRGFLKELFGVLDEKGVGDKLQDAVNQLYLASMPDLSWAKHGIHRKGTPGFSQDARRAFAQNMFHGGRYLAKLRYADQLQDKLTKMQDFVDAEKVNEENKNFDPIKAQDVVDEYVKRHDSLMNPKSNPLSTALTSFGFVFHMGLSPASAMVNLSGTALVAYPIMGAKWGFDKSAKELLIASKQAATNKNDISSALTGDERAAYDAAVKAGTIDVTAAHDLAGIAQGEDAGVMWKLRPVMKWASFLFHHAERFNRQVTFVASYRLARGTGANHEAAYEQATKATYDGHFDYSASNRPRIMQGNAVRVLLLFKQYGQNMVYTLSRQAQLAMNAETPEGRKEARKALGGLLVMHASAAGVLGLPLVGPLLAMASMLGGSDDEPWDAETALRNMLADTFGQKPAEVMAKGFSRLTPFDISGRVGLNHLIMPDIQEGLEGQRLGESAMAAALGPVAGIGINLLKGMQEISEGHTARGFESMMPAALRGPMKALRYEQEGAKDKTGVVIQDEVGAAGVFGQALGFSPSDVRNATEGRSAIFKADQMLMQRRKDLMSQFAQAAGDSDAIAQVRESIKKFNEVNPDRRINNLQLIQSVRNKAKRVAESESGVFLPKKRRDALEEGRFATME